MATFLKNPRKKNEPTVKPAVNGGAPQSPTTTKTPETTRRIIREDKEENNTTEYEVCM